MNLIIIFFYAPRGHAKCVHNFGGCALSVLVERSATAPERPEFIAPQWGGSGCAGPVHYNIRHFTVICACAVLGMLLCGFYVCVCLFHSIDSN